MVVSSENELGLKSNGDGDRTTPGVGSEGKSCKLCGSSAFSGAKTDRDSGDSEAARFKESSLDGGDDSASGFAIRRPPNDSERLRSPSILRLRDSKYRGGASRRYRFGLTNPADNGTSSRPADSPNSSEYLRRKFPPSD